MPAYFEPPAYLEGSPLTGDPQVDRLMRFYKPRPVGHSVWKIDGEWHEGTSPEARVTKQATHFFYGGAVTYIADDAVAQELVDLGYTVSWVAAPDVPLGDDFIWGGDAFSGDWTEFIWGGDASGASEDYVDGGDSVVPDVVIYGGSASAVSSDEIHGGDSDTTITDFIFGGGAT